MKTAKNQYINKGNSPPIIYSHILKEDNQKKVKNTSLKFINSNVEF